jgi:putative ABC transport system permease protein
MSYGLGGIEEPTRIYLEQAQQEDFSVEILNMITEEESENPELMPLLKQGIYALSDIKTADAALFYQLMNVRRQAFESAYDGVSLELRELKATDFEAVAADGSVKTHKALLVKAATQINLSFLEAGRLPSADHEIAINKAYGDKNQLQIGDTLQLGQTTYTITGFVLLPDYTLPMFDNSFNFDPASQTLILTTDAEYEAFSGQESFRFAGLTTDNQPVDTTYDRQALPFVLQIIPTAANMRSGAIYDELDQGKVIGLGLSLLIMSIALIIVCILIYNLLNSERSKIGLLKAMGYRRREIARPYFLSILVLACLMLISGYILGYFCSEPLKQLYIDFYLLPSVKITQNLFVFLTAVLVPLAFFALVSAVVINGILKEKALSLLQPRHGRAINRLGRVVSRLLFKAKGRTKFKYLYVIRNTGRFFIFFIGILFSTILINFAFMANGILDRMTTEYLNKVDYQYQAFVDPTKGLPEMNEGDEKFLSYPYGYLGDKLVTLLGLSPSNSLYRLFDESGADRTTELEQGAIITKKLSMKTGLKEGDSLEIKVNKKWVTSRVTGITDEYISDTIYLNIATLSELLTQNNAPDYFNGIYATAKPDPDHYKMVISKSSLIEQSQAMSNYMSLIINVMMSGSILIAGSILFVLTTLAVENNFYTISLLKVMGYRRREINSMILNSYFTYALISYLISLPIAIVILNQIMTLFITDYGIVMPLEFKPVYIAIGILVLLIIFLLGTTVSRFKIKRIQLQEALKTYSE